MTPHPIDQITVKEPVQVQNLAIFPLFMGQVQGPDYVSSSVAIEQHGMEVTEISDSGSVPNLMVVNPSSLCVLLLDGEELRGAKQNRIINTSILLAARSRTTIPVSCTESGRWSYNSPTFQTAKTVMPTKARRRKTRSVSFSLMHDQAFSSDQGEVWNEVEELHAKLGSHSPTSAMADAYAKMRQDLDEAIERIPAQEAQCGLIAMIDGKPAGMDLISRPEVYSELHAQLVQSYAMEALASLPHGTVQPGKGDQPVPGLLAAKGFLERCAAIKGKPYQSVGLGTDWRFIEGEVVGSGLEVDDAWVHMAYFLDDADASQEHRENRRRMARMSRRSQYRRLRPDDQDDVVY